MSDTALDTRETQIPTVKINIPREVPRKDERLERKQTAWEATRKKIDQIKDGKGLGPDEGIKETLVGLTVLGINTVGSCEGHVDRGHLLPWVDIAAPNRPAQYIDEEQAYAEAGERLGITAEEFQRKYTGATLEGAQVHSELANKGETDAFKTWREKSSVMAQQVQKYIDEFYRERQSDQNARIAIEEDNDGEYRIKSGEDEKDYEFVEIDGIRVMKAVAKSIPQEEATLLLLERRAEMAAFTDFLRNKYFSQP